MWTDTISTCVSIFDTDGCLNLQRSRNIGLGLAGDQAQFAKAFDLLLEPLMALAAPLLRRRGDDPTEARSILVYPFSPECLSLGAIPMIGGGTLLGRSIGIVLYCKSIPWSAPVDLYFVAYGVFPCAAARRARLARTI